MVLPVLMEHLLHIISQLVGVKRGQDVISQALTFVATCNAISYLGASPLFIDVDLDALKPQSKSAINFLKKMFPLKMVSQ